ncbi:MAG: hypothetical protein H6765_10975 [Candidatus Peribacteria bacterium]|nr:MAG: hypothetical protein H6765_10975 [Candidatus Peribacteria bacterium]
MLRVWWIATLILYTHPLQNWFAVLLVTLMVYAVINFVVGTGSVGTLLMQIRLSNIHAINVRRRVLLMLLYIVSTITMTAGQSMLGGFDHTTSTTSILLSIQ